MKHFILIVVLVYSTLICQSQDVLTKPLRQFGLGFIDAVVFHPEGRHILTTGSGGGFLWDISTGEIVRSYFSGQRIADFVEFSPDGTRILTSTWVPDATLRIWNTSTGELLQTITGDVPWLLYATLSPNGKQILTGGWFDRSARLYDAVTGEEIGRFLGHDDVIYWVAFSPDGTQILTQSGQSVRLWDVATRRQLRVFRGLEDAVSFSPDGSQILTRDALWDIATGQILHSFASSAAFSPDGRQILTGGWADNTAKLHDAVSGEVLRTFQSHTGRVGRVTFSPDGTRVLTVADNTPTLWDATTGQEIRRFVGHTNIGPAAFFPDGTRILTGGDTVRLWDQESGKLLRTFESEIVHGSEIALSPDGSALLAGGTAYAPCVTPPCADTAVLYDLATGTKLRTFAADDEFHEFRTALCGFLT